MFFPPKRSEFHTEPFFVRVVFLMHCSSPLSSHAEVIMLARCSWLLAAGAAKAPKAVKPSKAAKAASKVPKSAKAAATTLAASTAAPKLKAPRRRRGAVEQEVVHAPLPPRPSPLPPPRFVDGAPRSIVTILDGHAFLYRAFHVYDKTTDEALKSPEAAAKHARRAVRGHIGQAFYLRPPGAPEEGYATREVVVCLDGGRYARLDVLPEYKSNRAALHREDSDAFIAAGMEELRSTNRITVVPRVRGAFAAEADDLIFTLVKRAVAAGGTDSIVITHDKDLYQLMDESRRVFFHGLRDRGFVSAADVEKKMGVRPDQIQDYLALVGDKVDMIPGITGLGGQRAAKMLQQHGTLEGVYQAALRAGDKPLAKYFPASATAAVRDEIGRARKMRDEVIALRDVAEPFEGHVFEFEQLQAAARSGSLTAPL
jgi:5'-3' exonuclease